ncbi:MULTISPECIES: TolC family protein [Sulfurimonas]|uniref:TolC family protein n=1 Tax=Sulfurimonas TaxID=202746 RepID=UPI001263F9FA|nr:TolC family protein [Sulfurimonas indica]
MKNLLLGALLLASSLSAMTLSELIESSLSRAPSLEIINARLVANKQNIDIADQFENPELLLTKNTIDSSQAMSQTVLTLKQKIPTYSKREKREDIALSEEKLLQEKLHAAKVKLVGRIKNEAYTIWELREEIQIIDEYIILTRQNIRLYESYTSVDNNQHMGIMKAELSLSDLKVQRSALEAKKAAAYARLSYLAALKVTDLTIDLSIKKKPNLQQLQNSLKESNPDLLITQKEIQKQSYAVALAEINNYPDINLIAGYAYREKFDNYFNFGVGLSLPIYGTEDAKEEKERAILLEKKSKQSDIELAVLAQLELYYEQMLSSYKIHHIIQDEALPQVAHMFELSSSSISVGSDLFKYIDVLFQKLDLEKKSIKAVANYKRAEAQISQLRGEIK